jgi:hypothetical protein
MGHDNVLMVFGKGPDWAQTFFVFVDVIKVLGLLMRGWFAQDAFEVVSNGSS